MRRAPPHSRSAEDRRRRSVVNPRPSASGLPLKFDAALLELLKDLRRTFYFNQRAQLLENVIPVKPSGLAYNNSLDVYPVLPASGERLHDHQILRGTSLKRDIRRKHKIGGTRDHKFLEGQAGERDIQPDPILSAEQQDAPLEREQAGIRYPRFKMLQQHFDVRLLAAKTGQQGEIGVYGLPGLSPAQQGKTANKTKPPIPLPANRLELTSRSNDFSHVRPLSETSAVVR